MTPLSLPLQLPLTPSLPSPWPQPTLPLTSSAQRPPPGRLASALECPVPARPWCPMGEDRGAEVGVCAGVIPVGSMSQREAGGGVAELDLPELLPQPVSLWEYRGCKRLLLVRPVLLSLSARPVLLSLSAPPASCPPHATLCLALTSSLSRHPEIASFLLRSDTGLCSSSKCCLGLLWAFQVQAKKQR